MNSSNNIKNYYVDAFYMLPNVGSDSLKNLSEISLKLSSDFLLDKNGKIFEIATDEKLTQEKLTKVISNIDIETLHGETALILAYTKQNHDNLFFGEINEPRLKGLVSYYRYGYLNQMSFISEITRHLNEKGEIPFSSYVLSMKYYEPKYYRQMDCGFVADSKSSYENFMSLIKSFGYKIYRWPHSFEVISKNDKKRIRILENFSQFTEINRKYAKNIEILNSNYMIQPLESMVCFIIYNIWQKLRNGCLFSEIILFLWDLYYILNKMDDEFSYKILKDVLCEKNMTVQYLFISRFINGIIPNTLKADLFTIEEEEIRNFLEGERKYIKGKYKRNGEIKHNVFYIGIRKIKEFLYYLITK